MSHKTSKKINQRITFDAYNKIIDISSLVDSPYQTNKHTERQIKQLAKMMRVHGISRPIEVVRGTNRICFGHARRDAAKLNGWKKYPVVYHKFASAEEERVKVTSDNAVATQSELDQSLIQEMALELGPDFDFELFGVDDFKVIGVDTLPPGDEDSCPTPPVDPTAKRGDIWILGNHRLMCGDSISVTDVERLMAGEKAVMWSSDPPYGINHVDVANKKGQAKGYSKIENDDKQDDELREFIQASITTALPFLSDNFAFYMWHAMKMQAYFSQAAAAAGILFHRQIIWVKPQFVFGRGQYHWRHELCLMGWLKGNEPPFYGERNQSTVWEIGRENDKIHPTQKPVELFAIPIRNHCKSGEIVYEPFSGSGSNLIACEKEGARCFAMEIDPRYVDTAVKRWEVYTGKKAELSPA